jgi:hypothetical protein
MDITGEMTLISSEIHMQISQENEKDPPSSY